MTDAELKALVLSQLRITDATQSAAMTTTIASLWTLYADEARIHPQLRYLRTLHDALLARIFDLAETAIDWKEADVSESRSQIVKHLESLLKPTALRIDFLMSQLRANRAPKIGVITRTQPILREDTVDIVEPSDRAYRGDTLRRS